MRGDRPTLSAGLLKGQDARLLAERLSRMRGAVMKLGQLVSMDGKGMLPPELVEVLAPLRDGAHIMPFSQLVGVLETEYGSGWEKRFRRFRFNPIAAASIGQVHRAETRDGRELAIKVQYPGVRESIDSDVANLTLLLRLLGPLTEGLELEPTLEEARRQLHQEADYVAEARALAEYRNLLGDDPVLRVPAVHEDLTTPRVLAMDFTDGVSVDALASGASASEVRDRVAEALSRLVLRELFELGVVQTDPNFANYLYDKSTGRVSLLDFGAVRRVDRPLAEAYRNLARAAMSDDRQAVKEAAIAMGYLAADAPAEHADGLVDLILMAGEPLRHHGPYDFAMSDLFGRAQACGQDLVFRRGFKRTPPGETLFLHRKFVGTFLLCTRLRARVNVHSLVRPWLE